MEKEFKIKTDKGKYIYCRLRGSLNESVVVFVHGFTGHMNEHIFYNGVRFFEKNGFSTLCFNLYGDEDDARKLHECDLNIHSADLNRVVNYLKNKKVKNIFIVGHSYGGPTILLSNTENYKAIVLWDPSFHFRTLFKNKTYSKEFKGYFKEWSFKFFIGDRFVKEAEDLVDRYWEITKKNNSPTKVILAEKGNAQSMLKKDFFTALNLPKDMIEIKKAGHTFSEDGVEEKLFHETLKWFKKFNRK